MTVTFSRIKISEYGNILSNLSGKLQGLQESALNNSVNIAESMDLLNTVNSLTQNISFIAFVFLPLSILLIYVILQGLSYKITYSDFKNSLMDRKYFLRFLIVGFSYFLYIFLILKYVLPDYDNRTVFASEEALNNVLRSSSLILVLIFIGFCVAITYYALLKKERSWKETLGDTIERITKKPSIILLNLGAYLLGAFRLMVIGALIQSYISKEALFFSFTATIIAILVSSLVIAYYKNYLVRVINN
ncbi:hypothetical protein HYT58_01105 [Candidatus Woesearchaeota archaeon]|nr:hypothetical protein [Candidatus Woesearchaeota archaeon]